MELTKRQEKQLNKVFDDPKKLKKWVEEVIRDERIKYDTETKKIMSIYIELYNIFVAFTLHEELGLGKRRLPEVMLKIKNNMDCFETGYLSLEDCIGLLKHYNIDCDGILEHSEEVKKMWNRVGKIEL